ncbi:isoprenylcysteine carboxyl methyltransferase family protein [Paracoccus tegillarcae]|uniref:isoprenylcysteine carboxyl methyltransferase family protein n=1 Tax=Paracoccus tegillarcae TaxID=1529068 RepID=UPI003BB14F0E
MLFLAVQRLAELFIARRNTRRLLAQGAREYGAGHYPLIVALHATWLIATLLFGINQPVQPSWLMLFVVLQLGRVWVLLTLGERWTTRIIVLDKPLVTKGPFRLIRHPNYFVVVCEIFVAPMVLGLFWIAVIFTLFNALMLSVRLRAEETALRSLRHP